MGIPFGRTFIKNLWREIRSSFGRFFSIFAIVALGAGFLTGLMMSTPDMKYSMDRYYDESLMMDLNIKGTLGLTEDDASALADLEVTEKLLAARVLDVPVFCFSGTDSAVENNSEGGSPLRELAARIYGLPLAAAFEAGAINRLTLVEGRLPEKPEECLALEGSGYISHLPPGTVVRIEEDAGDEEDFTKIENFNVKEFTVTGIVHSPLYTSTEREPGNVGNGRIGAVLFVHEEAFALGFYTDFFIVLKGARNLLSYSDAYQSLVDRAALTVEETGSIRSIIRADEVLVEARAEAFKRLAEAEAEYLEGREKANREFAAAQERLDSAERTLAEAGTELERGREQLETERRRVMEELASNEEALRQGAEQIAAARVSLADAEAQLDANREQVERTRNSRLQMILSGRARRGVEQFDQAVEQYEEGLARVHQEEQRIEEGKSQLAQGRETAVSSFEAAERELDQGSAEIVRSLEQVLGGRREFETRRRLAEKELADAERRIRTGRNQAQNPEIPESRWYVLDRNTNVSAVSYGMNIEKISDLSVIFPVFFTLVAALVALTTMTRMVEEERSQIGTLKALGYRKRIIAAKYIAYSGITGIAGAAAGMLSGFRILPQIIYLAFSTMCRLPPVVLAFNWPLGAAVSALFVIAVTGATIGACYRSLREKPAALLLPKAPKPGKRIFLENIPFVWRRMKFTWKITARNLLRYKTHFIMTVTGIAGCTALMLSAFGLRDSLIDIARTQFTSIYKYDLRIERREQEEEDAVLHDFLARHGDWTALRSAPGFIADSRNRYSAVFYVPENGGDFTNFISIGKRGARERIAVEDDAIIITEKIAELLGVSPGGEIILQDSAGKAAAFTVTSTTENYAGLPVYLGKNSWQVLFGKAETFPEILVKSGIRGESGEDAALSELLAGSSVAEAEFTANTQESWNRLLFSISFVVLVLTAAAGGLGAIVLFNLTNININERTRELATLRVLGFRRQEAAFYIFREISVLTLLGTAAGLVLGIFLHRFIISVAENPDLMFGRSISAASFVLSALFTVLFSALVDVLMLRKINKINMAESLKSPD